MLLGATYIDLLRKDKIGIGAKNLINLRPEPGVQTNI